MGSNATKSTIMRTALLLLAIAAKVGLVMYVKSQNNPTAGVNFTDLPTPQVQYTVGIPTVQVPDVPHIDIPEPKPIVVGVLKDPFEKEKEEARQLYKEAAEAIHHSR